MNIQDVINRALEDNSDIAIAEIRENPEVVDIEITKLASALNFIGTNLEHSIPSPREVIAQARLTSGYLEKVAFNSAESAINALFHPDTTFSPEVFEKYLLKGQKKGYFSEGDVARFRRMHKAGVKPDAREVYGAYKSGNLGEFVNQNVSKSPKMGTPPPKMRTPPPKMRTPPTKMSTPPSGSTGITRYGHFGNQSANSARGASQASSGASQASSGASQASRGASQASSGASQASSGTSQASSGATRKSRRSPQTNIAQPSFLRRAGEFTGILDSGRGGMNRAGRLAATTLGTGIAAYGAKKAYDHFKSNNQEKNAYYGLVAPALVGVGSHMHARERMARAGMTDRDIDMYDDSPSMLGSIGRSYGYGLGGTVAGGFLGGVSAGDDLAKGMERGSILGPIGGLAGMYMGHRATQKHTDRAINRYKTDKRIKQLSAAHNKTASLNDPLYQAAQLGKESLLEKIAEDRINPAKISAGPADPYSGQIMPNPGAVSSEFVGSSRTPKALIDLKAQKVRDRINSDMKKYVKNVGDGYNMQGHLSKFNK